MNFCTKIGRIDWGRAGTRSGEWPEKVSKWAISICVKNFKTIQVFVKVENYPSSGCVYLKDYI